MVWYGIVNMNLYSTIVAVFNALSTLGAREKPSFQVLSKGLIVLLCARRGRPARSSRPWGLAQRMLGANSG